MKHGVGNGRTVMSSPSEHPCQVLALLIESPGELVSREDLRRRLWPNDTFVDFDHGVNIAVNKLRDALGDSAENPRFIETLPRRGYRFIAPVEGAKTSRNGELPAHVASSPAGRAGLRSILSRRALLPALLVLSLGVLSFSFVRHRRVGSAENSIRSLAVLPLENLSPDPAQDYFADGMTDELITSLAKLQTLKVTLGRGERSPDGRHDDTRRLGRGGHSSSVRDKSLATIRDQGGSGSFNC